MPYGLYRASVPVQVHFTFPIYVSIVTDNFAVAQHRVPLQDYFVSVLMDGVNTSVYHRIIMHLPNSQFYTTITKTNHTNLH